MFTNIRRIIGQKMCRRPADYRIEILQISGGLLGKYDCWVNSISLMRVEGLQKQIGFDGCY